MMSFHRSRYGKQGRVLKMDALPSDKNNKQSQLLRETRKIKFNDFT